MTEILLQEITDCQRNNRLRRLLETAEALASQEAPGEEQLAQLAVDCVCLLWQGLSPHQVALSARASLLAKRPLIAGPESLEQALAWSSRGEPEEVWAD